MQLKVLVLPVVWQSVHDRSCDPDNGNACRKVDGVQALVVWHC